MATWTALTSSSEQMSQNPLECTICQGRYTQPKILDCMHSFCEKCLEKHCRGAAKILCPECQQEMAVPEQGVQGFTTNYHLVGKVEKELREKMARACSGEEKLICETCEEGNEAMHCCLVCAQNICSTCQRSHLKIAATASHITATLEDFKQGKVVLKKDDNGSRCHKHEKEMKIYCQTCQESICQECTTENHSGPDHSCTDSVSASVNRRHSLTKLLHTTAMRIKELETFLEATSQSRQEIRNKIKSVTEDVQDEAAKVREEVTTQENDLIDQIKTAESSYCKPLNEHEETVTMVLRKAQYSLEMVADIESTASDINFLSLYPIISKMLQSLSNQGLPETDQRLAYLKFRRTPEIGNICLGKLELDVKWEMQTDIKSFGEGRFFGQSKFSSACGIVALRPDEIAVTDCGFSIDPRWQKRLGRVEILTINGRHKRTIQMTKTSDPLGIAASQNLLMVADGTNCIQIFDKDNTQMSGEFSTKHSWFDSIKSFVMTPVTYFANLVSVAVKKDGTIIVGDVRRKVLTVHTSTDCSVKRTIPLKVTPSYLAVDDTTGSLVASDQHEAKVAVLQDNGDEAFTIKPKIKGQKDVQCKGICCDSSGVYVAVHGKAHGTGHIHRYDVTSGAFLGCIIEGLHCPCGITFTADRLQLAVADTSSVKIYNKV